jgi:predicted secreted hydrolase
MRSRWIPALFAFVATLSAQQWQIASPAYRYEFPRDYFSHPAYQTEWWYYTGNLRALDGHRFGFELTFFRVGMHLPARAAAEADTTWRPDQIYLAHFAVSDIDGGKFYHTERLNRGGPGLAGASVLTDTRKTGAETLDNRAQRQQRAVRDAAREEPTTSIAVSQRASAPFALSDRSYWNGNWHVHWTSLDQSIQQLEAVSGQFTLRLTLHPAKPLVVHGRNGISQKGPDPSEASHYLSFTRLLATGSLESSTSRFQLNGLAWMDHEFFSEKRNGELAGWDWFAIQLDNGEEVMLYRLRLKSGAVSPYSSGTFIDAQGHGHFLKRADFSLAPGGEWKSPQSETRYPLAWHITIPCLGLQLDERTQLKNQELFSKDALTPTYWEGAVTYDGEMHGRQAHGVGYLEMTGYNQAVWFRER